MHAPDTLSWSYASYISRLKSQKSRLLIIADIPAQLIGWSYYTTPNAQISLPHHETRWTISLQPWILCSTVQCGIMFISRKWKKKTWIANKVFRRHSFAMCVSFLTKPTFDPLNLFDWQRMLLPGFSVKLGRSIVSPRQDDACWRGNTHPNCIVIQTQKN